MPSEMTDKEWRDWHYTVKCKWMDCYAGQGLAGNGSCHAGGDFKDPGCPKYRDENEFTANDAKIVEDVGL
jgi:hypothetical protein